MARFTIYRSSDSGAPVLTGEVGKLVALLDACLVNGYTASVTSITRSVATATVTVPVPHNLITGDSITIAGAAQTDYNITAVVTVTSAVTFTYTVGGTPATPATGVITYLRIAAGWTKAFTGTNKASFKQGSGSNGFYVRVQDDAAVTAKESRTTGYETMSDVDTGTGPFPTAAQGVGGVAMVVARKSATADATARNWILVADSRTFYLFVLTGDVANTYYSMWFGEFYSLLPSDGFRVGIAARTTENSSSSAVEKLVSIRSQLSEVCGNWIARGHNGTGGSVEIGKHSDLAKSGANSSSLFGIVPYTNPANGAFYVSRIWIHDPTTTPVGGLRGRMRGFWLWLHAITAVTDGDVLTGSGELAGKTFLVIKQTGNADGSGNFGIFTIETSSTVETN
jgi:hypothetical protein